MTRAIYIIDADGLTQSEIDALVAANVPEGAEHIVLDDSSRPSVQLREFLSPNYDANPLTDLYILQIWKAPNVIATPPNNYISPGVSYDGDIFVFRQGWDLGDDNSLQSVIDDFAVPLETRIDITKDTTLAIKGSWAGDQIAGGISNNIILAGGGDDVVYGDAGDDKLYGGDGNDRVFGGSDDDILYGGFGQDRLNGGDGMDTLYGGADIDHLSGGKHADTLYGGDNDDRLYGGDGDDTLNGDNGEDKLYGGAGTDTLYGNDGEDRLYGEDGIDFLYGNGDKDRLYGGVGDDWLYGGLGDDILNGEAGNDKLDGGGGKDTYRFTGNFGTDTLSDFDPNMDKILISIGFEDNAYYGATYRRSDDSQTLTVFNGPEVEGIRGYIRLNGTATFADDLIVYDDRGEAIPETDDTSVSLTFGHTGFALVDENTAFEFDLQTQVSDNSDLTYWVRDVHGANSPINASDFTFNGNTLTLSAGFDHENFSDDDGTLLVEIIATNGHVRETTFLYIQTNDTDDEEAQLVLADGETYASVTVSGTVKNNDTVLYTMEVEDIDGFSAGDSDDFSFAIVDTYGVPYTPTLPRFKITRNEADKSQADILFDNRFFYAGTYVIVVETTEADSLTTAEHNITITLSEDANFDLTGTANTDLFVGTDNDDIIRGGGGKDYLYGLEGADIIYGEGGDDIIEGEGDNDKLYGGAGKDSISGASGDDELFGGDNDDKLYGDADNDTLHGDGGKDKLYGGGGHDILHGGDDNDTLRGGSGDDTLNGGDGIDYLYGEEGTDTLNGGDGRDYLYGGSDNIGDILNGDGGDDILAGGNGDDTLRGGIGHDILFGNGGNDTLKGGSGTDTYNFIGTGFGHDTIIDFEYGMDTIILGVGASYFLSDDSQTISVTLAGELQGTIDFNGAAINNSSLTVRDTVGTTITLTELTEISFDYTGSATIDENAPLNFDLQASASNSSSLTYSIAEITGGNASLTANDFAFDNGTLTLANSANLDFESLEDNGIFTLTIVATNGTARESTSLTVQVNDLDDEQTTLESLNGLIEIDGHTTRNTVLYNLDVQDPDAVSAGDADDFSFVVESVSNRSGQILDDLFFILTPNESDSSQATLHYDNGVLRAGTYYVNVDVTEVDSGDIARHVISLNINGDIDLNLHGTDGKDMLYGDIGGNDTIYGYGEADTIYGSSGNDTIYGGEGGDRLSGGRDNDEIYGEAGDDVLYGDAGDDYLEGGQGTDLYYIGKKYFGNDTINIGDDTLFNGIGKPSSFEGLDFIILQDKYETAVYTMSDDRQVITVYNGYNSLTVLGTIRLDGTDEFADDFKLQNHYSRDVNFTASAPIAFGNHTSTVALDENQGGVEGLNLNLQFIGGNSASFTITDIDGLIAGTNRLSADDFIISSSGVLTLDANGLDREAIAGADDVGTLTLGITAEENGATATTSVTLEVNGVNDEAPTIEAAWLFGHERTYKRVDFPIPEGGRFDFGAWNLEIDFLLAMNDLDIGSASVNDNFDITMSGDSEYFTYHMTEENEAYLVVNSAGNVTDTVSQKIVDFEEKPVYHLTLNVSDTDANISDDFVLTFNIIDVDDTAAVLDSPASATIYNPQQNQEIYQMQVSDPDAVSAINPEAFSFSIYSAVDENSNDVAGNLSIDTSNGKISYAASNFTAGATYTVNVLSVEADSLHETATTLHAIELVFLQPSHVLNFDSSGSGSMWELANVSGSRFSFDNRDMVLFWDDVGGVDTQSELKSGYDSGKWTLGLENGDVRLNFANSEHVIVDGVEDFVDGTGGAYDFDDFVASMGGDISFL